LLVREYTIQFKDVWMCEVSLNFDFIEKLSLHFVFDYNRPMDCFKRYHDSRFLIPKIIGTKDLQSLENITELPFAQKLSDLISIADCFVPYLSWYRLLLIRTDRCMVYS
jgi:hypothetical protein